MREHVLGERALVPTVPLAPELAASGAERRPLCQAVLAGPTAWRRPADHCVAGYPLVDVVTDRDDVRAELVTLDRLARAAPTLEHEVQVRAAHTAVADLEQHVARADCRHRPLLDGEIEPAAQDRGPHRLGKLRHAASLATPACGVNRGRRRGNRPSWFCEGSLKSRRTCAARDEGKEIVGSRCDRGS